MTTPRLAPIGPPPPLRVALCGDARDASFAPALDCLAASRSAGRILVDSEVAQADLCLWFRDRPERRDEDVARLVAGGVETVAVLGSWCEGETRTGRPAEGVERVYWYDFPMWWRGREPLAVATLPLVARSGLVEVAAPDRASAAAVIDALEDAGAPAVWRRPHQGPVLATRPAAAVWVGGQLDGREAVLLERFAARFRRQNLPLTVLLDFPRLDSWQAARDMGATAVLGKPWRAEALVMSLTAIAPPAIAASPVNLSPKRQAA